MACVSIAAKLVQLGCGAIDFADALGDHIIEPDADTKVQIAIKSVQLAFGIVDVGCKIGKVSNITMSRVKAVETIVAGASMPFKIGTAVSKYHKGRISLSRAIELGIASFVTVSRSALEASMHQEKHWLQMSDEQRSKEFREETIYHGEDEFEVIRRPVTKEECESNLKYATEALNKMLPVEVISRMGVASKGLQIGKESLTTIYQKIARRLAAQSPAVNAVPPRGTATMIPAAPIDPFDFVAQNQIPIELHEDNLFMRYRCGITLAPTLDPVGDPTILPNQQGQPATTVIYDRAAISEWIRRNGTSPNTRLPLTIAQLVEKPVLKLQIRRRLQMHADLIRQAAANHPVIPTTVADQANLDQENPGL